MSGGEHQELVLKTFERRKKFMVIDLGGESLTLLSYITCLGDH